MNIYIQANKATKWLIKMLKGKTEDVKDDEDSPAQVAPDHNCEKSVQKKEKKKAK